MKPRMGTWLPKYCGHDTKDDHSFRNPQGIRIWECSFCRQRAPWGPLWAWFGAAECRTCGYSDIEHVHCGECDRSNPKPRPTAAELRARGERPGPRRIVAKKGGGR